MKYVQYTLTHSGLTLLFAFASLLVVLPFFGALENLHPTLKTILGILGFAWFLLILMASHVMSTRMVFEGLDFPTALRSCLVEAQVSMSFMPLIGRWFGPKPEPPNTESNDPIE